MSNKNYRAILILQKLQTLFISDIISREMAAFSRVMALFTNKKLFPFLRESPLNKGRNSEDDYVKLSDAIHNLIFVSCLLNASLRLFNWTVG